jgi:hypothetical protein
MSVLLCADVRTTGAQNPGQVRACIVIDVSALAQEGVYIGGGIFVMKPDPEVAGRVGVSLTGSLLQEGFTGGRVAVPAPQITQRHARPGIARDLGLATGVLG